MANTSSGLRRFAANRDVTVPRARWTTVASIAVASVLLTSCWESDTDDDLYIANNTGRQIVVFQVDRPVEQDRRIAVIEPMETEYVDPQSDGDSCTVGTVVVFQEDVEIDRINEPVCHAGGFTLEIPRE